MFNIFFATFYTHLDLLKVEEKNGKVYVHVFRCPNF